MTGVDVVMQEATCRRVHRAGVDTLGVDVSEDLVTVLDRHVRAELLPLVLIRPRVGHDRVVRSLWVRRRDGSSGTRHRFGWNGCGRQLPGERARCELSTVTGGRALDRQDTGPRVRPSHLDARLNECGD